MVWTKERITFSLLSSFTGIQHTGWRSKSKHENAIDDQECSKKCSHNVGLPGEKPCKVDYDSTQFYFLIKNCIFLLTRSLYLVRSLSHEIDCKISPILPLWESTPGASIGGPISLRQALGVEHDATFCFSRFHQGKSFPKRTQIRILRTNMCVKLPRQEEVLTRHFQRIFSGLRPELACRVLGRSYYPM